MQTFADINISSNKAQCREIPSICLYVYGQLLLSDEIFFFVGYDSNNYSLYFYKAEYEGNSIVWGNKILWNSGTWSSSYSESQVSADSSKIYSIASYGSTFLYMYITTFNAINGNAIGGRYKSNIAWGGVYGSTLNGAYIVITASWTPFNILILYNTDSHAISIKQFSNSLFQTTVDPNNGR